MDESTALQRIRRTLPEQIISQVEINPEGLVHDVVIINGERVFRFPKTDWARGSLRKEMAILDLMREHVEMTVPHYDIRDEDMGSYRLIPSRGLTRDDLLALDEAGQERIAAQLGTFLRQIHAIPAAEIAVRGIPPSDASRPAGHWARMFAEVQARVFPLLLADQRAWVERLFAPALADPGWPDYPPALIDGDLGPYHILYDEQTQSITGVVDFGTAGVGDPAVDFAAIINALGESFLRRMAPHCPSIAAAIDRARFYAGAIELEWVLNGLKSGETFWFTAHIGRARDVRPIGSGW
jgi:aminoglycoside 2''-phosphotransferase